MTLALLFLPATLSLLNMFLIDKQRCGMIKVMAKANAVMKVVEDRRGIGFGDIQRALGWNKATLSQILRTMTELGWLERKIEGGFIIGPRIIDLARPELARTSLHHAAFEAVSRLAAETGETASVSILEGGRRVRIAKQDGHSELIVDDRPAALDETLWDTATGRLLVAFEPIKRRNSLIVKLHEADSTIDYVQALTEIKESGFSIMESKNRQVRSFAYRVSTDNGVSALAAIGISVPAYRCTASVEREYLSKIVAAARQMEASLKPALGEIE